MAKELPYFKFEPSEWENGNIQICSREDKGLFIDLCALYWSRIGDVPFKLAVQKLCGGNATAFDSLMDSQIFRIIDGMIYIEFLDLQLQEFENLSIQNKENALKGWEKRRNNKALSDRNATASISQCENDAIREEKIREEEKREKKKRIEIKIESLNFSNFDFPEDAIEIWTIWITYKKEQHKDIYASKSSMQTALNQLCKLSKGNSKIANEIVNNSIANLYKGLFELKTTTNTESQKPKEYEPNAHLLKIVNRLERDGDITTKQAEIARVTIANATTFINVSTFMDGLKNLEKLGEDSDLLDNGNTLRIG